MTKGDYNHLYKVTMKSVFFCMFSICLSVYVKVMPDVSKTVVDISEMLPKMLCFIIPFEIIEYLVFKNIRNESEDQ